MAGVSAEKGRALLESGQYSDFTIVCKGKEWKVHKSVVCSESEYFGTVAKGNFDGGATDRCELKEEDPGLIHLVLDWMYTGDYETKTDPEPAPVLTFIPAENQWRDLGGVADNTESENDDGEDDENEDQEGDEDPSKSDLDKNADGVKHSDWVAFYTEAHGDWRGRAGLNPKKAEQSLLTHLFVYTAADRLGISGLQEQASGAFMDLTRQYFETPYLAGIVEQLFDNTASQDKLRSELLAYCFESYASHFSGWSTDNKAVAQLMKKYEPVAWSFAEQWKPIEADMQFKIQKLTSERTNVEVSRDGARDACNVAEERNITYRTTLTSLEDYFRKGNFICKSCGTDLVTKAAGFKIEEMDTDPGGVKLSVPKVFIVCSACQFKDFTEADAQPTGDKAYALPYRQTGPSVERFGPSRSPSGIPPAPPPQDDYDDQWDNRHVTFGNQFAPIQ